MEVDELEDELEGYIDKMGVVDKDGKFLDIDVEEPDVGGDVRHDIQNTQWLHHAIFSEALTGT